MITPSQSIYIHTYDTYVQFIQLHQSSSSACPFKILQLEFRPKPLEILNGIAVNPFRELCHLSIHRPTYRIVYLGEGRFHKSFNCSAADLRIKRSRPPSTYNSDVAQCGQLHVLTTSSTSVNCRTCSGSTPTTRQMACQST